MKITACNPVVKILMERDNMSEDDAMELVQDVADEMAQSLDRAEDILLEELGLEPDYLFDLVGL